MRTVGLKLLHMKCVFCIDEISVLAHIVRKEGDTVAPEKIHKLKDARLPRSRRVLRFSQGFRSLLSGVTEIVRPFRAMSSDSTTFELRLKPMGTFNILKEGRSSTHVVAFPDCTETITVFIDALKVSIGDVLMETVEVPVDALNPSKKLYPAQYTIPGLSKEERG